MESLSELFHGHSFFLGSFVIKKTSFNGIKFNKQELKLYKRVNLITEPEQQVLTSDYVEIQLSNTLSRFLKYDYPTYSGEGEWFLLEHGS